jgi:hypothetical protein
VAGVPNLDNLPNELKGKRRWVTWDSKRRGGKTTKRPDQSVKNSNAWLSITEACDWVASGASYGVGFVLNGDGIVGIDLDGCIALDGTLHEIAHDLLAIATYTELSPSGRGIHAFIRAAIEKPRKISAKNGIAGREIYDGRHGSARYLTVTGDRIGEASELRQGQDAQTALNVFVAKWFPRELPPTEAAPEKEVDEPQFGDDEILELMFAAANGAKWRTVFEGDYSDYPSQSEADFSLCRKLRFFTRANPAQMDRLFRRSGLMRPKWDEKRGVQSYGDITLAKALSAGGRLYSVPRPRYNRRTSSGQFGKIHQSALRILARQSKIDNLVYEALSTFADADTGECRPSAATIARLIGQTRENVQKSVGNLTTAGLISVAPRRGTTSIIRLLPYLDVSNFDTGKDEQKMTALANAMPSLPADDTRRQRQLSKPVGVSNADTPPVSNFGTQNRPLNRS